MNLTVKWHELPWVRSMALLRAAVWGLIEIHALWRSRGAKGRHRT